jgi:uncharacterized protein (DUF3084 family)
MRTLIILTCVATCLAASGCKNRWNFKWPGRTDPTATTQPAGNATSPTTQPARPAITSTLTSQQEIAQLQRQNKTLRDRLDIIEDENAKLRDSNKTVVQLQDALKKLAFTAKMQSDDLKVLKTAAIERDLYKTRSERLQREAKALNARVAKMLQRRAAKDPATAPATQPAGL